MKLRPNRTKFDKFYKGKAINRVTSKNNYFSQHQSGMLIIKTSMSARLNAKQIEIIHITLNKLLKKAGKTNITVFPHIPISKKPNEIRMGKGKGAVDHWACRVTAGCTLCEIETNSITKALKAIDSVKFRLPIKIRTLILE